MPLQDISENEFHVSDGWLAAFKKRAGLSSRAIHGEAASAPLDTLPAARAQLQGILAQYDPADVYNADETVQGPAPPVISDAEARIATEGLLTFVEQNTSTLNDAEKHREALLAVYDAVQKLVIRDASQRRITDYFQWVRRVSMPSRLGMQT